MSRIALLLSSFVVVLFACASKTTTDSTVIRVSDYATSCATDRDCVLAVDGDVCELCANAAVARSDTKYEPERARLAETCPGAATAGAAQCDAFAARCAAGACTAVRCGDAGAGTDAGACAP